MAQAAEVSGLPVPRFVSLRSEEVNLRTGPGVRYPIEWVVTKRDLPVEVVQEFETWRKIRDSEGTEGWVHQSMLSSRRTFLVTGGVARKLRKTDSVDSAGIALLEASVVGRILQCPRGKAVCRVEVAGHQGWLKRSDFWGLYRDEWIE